MPTKYQRIPVTNDPELSAALSRVERYFADKPAASIVRYLAIRGAEVFELEQRERERAFERLVEFSTERRDLIDWSALEHIDELAWGE